MLSVRKEIRTHVISLQSSQNRGSDRGSDRHTNRFSNSGVSSCFFNLSIFSLCFQPADWLNRNPGQHIARFFQLTCSSSWDDRQPPGTRRRLNPIHQQKIERPSWLTRPPPVIRTPPHFERLWHRSPTSRSSTNLMTIRTTRMLTGGTMMQDRGHRPTAAPVQQIAGYSTKPKRWRSITSPAMNERSFSCLSEFANWKSSTCWGTQFWAPIQGEHFKEYLQVANGNVEL